MQQNLPCSNCGQNTAMLTYAENQVYTIDCPCGCSYRFEETSETSALESYNELVTKLIRRDIFKVPFSIGDIVYFLVEEIDNCICGEIVTGVSTGGFFISSFENTTEGIGEFTSYEELGKSVFLTITEAEKALEVLNNA